MKLLLFFFFNISFINFIYCINWVNFIGYSNRNCSGVEISSIIKTNECIGESIYKCDKDLSTNTQFIYKNCEEEYTHKENKNNFCDNKGFTTSCSDYVNLPKDSYVLATYKNGSNDCTNDSNIQQYNIIPLGVCDSGLIYQKCKNGVIYYNIYKDLQCSEIANKLELRLGCQYSDSTFTTFINSFCT